MSAVITQSSIGLDTLGKKFSCPSCGQKRFVRMWDAEAKEYLPHEVGRCDRENSCGYHLTAKQYFESKGLGYKPQIKEVEIKPEVIDLIPLDYVKQSMKHRTFMESNFAQWLCSLFGETIAEKALLEYLVGRSKNDNGKACIFWRIDSEENVRTGKIMCYNPETGKRNKEINPTWVHKALEPFNYKLPFFGEHLLTEYPDKTIGIVESEKSAIIASIYMQDMVWLATGGNSGCKWREWSVYNVLKDRKVILFPDFGYFNKKTKRTCFAEWSERAEMIKEKMQCSITVSRVLEDLLQPEERLNDYDLADMLIKRKDGKGWALNEVDGYPVMFELHPKIGIN